MRLALAFLITACGDAGTTPNNPTDGGSKPGCEPCATQLVNETNPCGPMLDQCTNSPMNTLEQNIACFQQDGRCYSDALGRSSSCHRQCGDEEQANVESCTAVCFTTRAGCAEQTLRRYDACLDICAGDPLGCELCDQRSFQDFDACDADAVDCSETCKRTHRGG